MQAAAWGATAGGASAAHDLCISAPTGSGKTLAYALPIVQGLAGCARSGHCRAGRGKATGDTMLAAHEDFPETLLLLACWAVRRERWAQRPSV